MAVKKQKLKINSIKALISAVFLAGFLFLYLGNQPAEASSISKKFNYQGRLGDASGNDKADGAYDMVFKIYPVAGGGTAPWTETWTSAALWTEASSTTIAAGTGGNGCSADDIKITYSTTTHDSSLKAGQTLWNTTKKTSAVIDSVNNGSTYICAFTPITTWDNNDNLTNRVYVKNGIFSITLGTVSAMTLDFASGDYYLGVNVENDGEMTPRKPMTSVPQAINANNLGGDGIIDLDNTNTTQDAANIYYDPASEANNALVITYGSGGGTGSALKIIQSGVGKIAQFFDGTNSALEIIDGGNVGIGTSVPGSKLSISGGLSIGTTSPTSVYLTKLAPDGGAIFEGSVGIGTTNPAYSLQVAGSLGIGGTAYFGSNVGIGSTNPNATFTVGDANQFQVNSTGAIAAATGITSSGTITLSSIANDTEEATGIFINGSKQLVYREFGSNAFNSTTYMANPMDSAGDIVYGGASGTPTKLATGTGFLTNSGTTPQWTSAATDYFTQYALLAGRGAGQTLIGGTNPNGTLIFQGNSSGTGNTATNANMQFKVGNSGATTAMTILNSGYVGIGVTNPGQNLSVAGTLGISSTSAPYYTIFQGGGQVGDITYTLPVNDGDASQVLTSNGSGVLSWTTVTGGVTDHGALSGLLDDDHTQYALLAGRGAGQTLIGGTNPNGTLTFQGNSSGTGNTATNANMYFNVGNSGATTAMTILNSGNVGIGTTLPNVKLEILGTSEQLRLSYDGTYYTKFTVGGDSKLTVETSSGTQSMIKVGKGQAQNAGISFDGNTNDYYAGMDNTTAKFMIGVGLTMGTTPYVTIQADGKVGIGTTTPAYRLDVGGGNSGYDIRGYDVYTHDGGATSFSDIRLKTVTGNYSRGLDEIMKLNPILYRYLENNPLGLDSKEENIGLVAQELQKVIPEAVEEGQDGYFTVTSTPLLYAAINAIQDQQLNFENQTNSILGIKKNDESLGQKTITIEESLQNLAGQGLTLEGKVDEINGKVSSQEERLAALESQLNAGGQEPDLKSLVSTGAENNPAALDVSVLDSEGLDIVKRDLGVAQEAIKINSDKIEGLNTDVSQMKSDLAAFQNSLSQPQAGTANENELNPDTLNNQEGLVVVSNVSFKGKTIFATLAEFFGQVIFRDKVEFAGKVVFNKDTAGYAVVKSGQKEVLITFEQEYDAPPVVNATISLQNIEDPELRTATEELVLLSDVRYLVSNVTTKGFEIKINNSEDSDISFSWQAMAIKDAKTFETGTSDISGNFASDDSSIEASVNDSTPSDTNTTPQVINTNPQVTSGAVAGSANEQIQIPDNSNANQDSSTSPTATSQTSLQD